MKAFVWDSRLETGLEWVDSQHGRLVEMVNQVGDMLLDSNATEASLQTLFGELATYSIEHFAEEARLMHKLKVDARHKDAHNAQHKDFIAQLSSMWSRRAQSSNPAEMLHGYLTSWLIVHIMGVDQAMARQIAGIKAGLTPSAAFDKEESGKDNDVSVLLDALHNLYHVLAVQNKELATLNEGLEIKVAERTKDLEEANLGLASLLDNSGQGFLTFGHDLVINTQYSLACEAMLGVAPAGRNAADVFFHNDEAKSDLFCTVIPLVLDESDPYTRENMLSLLPVEIQRDNVILKAEYKILENGKFMVILTDITEERRMAALLHSERRHLELIVMAVTDNRNFFDTIDAFREFLVHGLPRMLKGTAAPQILAKELYREIHTYKGLLDQFSFPNTPKTLHDIETRLSSLLSLGDALTRQKVADFVSPEALQSPFDDDLAALSDALGEEFLAHGESITLTSDQALQLEKLAIRLLRGETVDTSVAEIRTLLNEMGTLRDVPLKDVLMGFDGLVRQAAERMEKKVAPIMVNGGADVWVNPHTYRPFLRSLVHVFRNTVAHGIETPEVRWEAEKGEAGKITCSVALEGSNIKLTIADDGAGIDLDALRQRAVAAGIYSADEVLNVSDDTIVQLIFMDNISIQQEVTELAGRGVGLAAVLNETKNMGGEIVVRTVAGQGTEFLFTLPLHQGTPSEER